MNHFTFLPRWRTNYERLKKKTAELQQEIPGYVKKIIEKNL